MIFSYSRHARHAVQGRACSLGFPVTWACLRTLSGNGRPAGLTALAPQAQAIRERQPTGAGAESTRQAAATRTGVRVRSPAGPTRQPPRSGSRAGTGGQAGRAGRSQAGADGGLAGQGAGRGPGARPGGPAGSRRAGAGSGWSEARPGGQERSVILRPAVDLAAIVARPAVALPWVPAGDPAGEHHRAPRPGDPQEPRVAKAADCPDHHRDEADAEP